MFNKDFSGLTVLVTGGSRGVGRATALAFGRLGAQTVITHRFGSISEDELFDAFDAVDAPRPLIVEANVADPEALDTLIERIAAVADGVDVFASNVAYGQPVGKEREMKFRSFSRTMEATAWPLISHTLALRARFGRPPRYVFGISSYGHCYVTPRYDLIAASKAALETLCMYLGARLIDEDCRVNIVRAELIKTESSAATFGAEAIDKVRELFPVAMVDPEEVADCLVMLASGLMDGVNGQVIDLDHGTRFHEKELFEICQSYGK